MSSRIILVDGYNVVYRLFYAVPSFTLRDGTPVNAAQIQSGYYAFAGYPPTDVRV